MIKQNISNQFILEQLSEIHEDIKHIKKKVLERHVNNLQRKSGVGEKNVRS